jgi:carboxylesterase
MDPLCAPFRLEGNNGEAVVLIHGFTGSPAHWRLLAPRLAAAGYTVVVPRLPGHGTSMEDLATTGAADWIGAAREAAGSVASHRRVHLAGLSMGGLIAILLAGPTAAATVTTVNSPLRFRNKQMYLTPLAHRVRPVVVWPEQDLPDLDPEARPLWACTYQGFPTRTAADLLRISRRARRAARRLRRPSLVIQSKTDETVDPVSGRLLARALGTQCRLVWLERSLHNALLDHERDVIEQALLERIR